MALNSSNLKVLAKLAKVKAELQILTKSANNPFYKSKYADLNTHLDEVEPRLEKEGLLLLQPVSICYMTGKNKVSSIIYDVESGESIESSMTLVGETDMQKAGSAITYGRRYTLGSLLAMQAEDDDANVASNKTTKAVSTKQPVPENKTYVGSASESKAATPATTRPSFRKKAAPAISSGDDI